MSENAILLGFSIEASGSVSCSGEACPSDCPVCIKDSE
jgi:hypothetical protein